MIHLLQLLCPARHCIIAVPFDPGEMSSFDASTTGLALMGALHINEWCGICGSYQLVWEDKETPWHTIEEAMPHLLKSELEQTLTRTWMESTGKTYDSQRKN